MSMQFDLLTDVADLVSSGQAVSTNHQCGLIFAQGFGLWREFEMKKIKGDG